MSGEALPHPLLQPLLRAHPARDARVLGRRMSEKEARGIADELRRSWSEDGQVPAEDRLKLEALFEFALYGPLRAGGVLSDEEGVHTERLWLTRQALSDLEGFFAQLSDSEGLASALRGWMCARAFSSPNPDLELAALLPVLIQRISDRGGAGPQITELPAALLSAREEELKEAAGTVP